MEFYDFPETLGNFMIPTDELIFFRGVGIPPTSVYTYIIVNGIKTIYIYNSKGNKDPPRKPH
jgi:hypothetical protein